MIISDTHSFAFIHIPKCAGSSVRATLMPYDERRERYYDRGVSSHPALGCVDYHHLPLQAIRDHFPDDFECLARYQSFAVVRDPFERFQSALAQHLRMYRNTRMSALTDRQLERSIDQVIRRLDQYGVDSPILEPEYVHFSPQHFYTHMENRRFIQSIYRIDDVYDMFKHISNLIGDDLYLMEENINFQFGNPNINKAKFYIQSSMENIIPLKIWLPVSHFLRDHFMRFGIYYPAREKSRKPFLSKTCMEFIERFYSIDLYIFEDPDCKLGASYIYE